LRSGLLAAALLAGACGGGASEAGGPRLSVAPSAFDFGNVVANKTVQRDFVLRNVGGAVLVIQGMTKTCECTLVGSYARTLDPGRSTTVRVALTTPNRPGPVEQAFAVLSNDPTQPRVEVPIRAMVVEAAKPN
jgi:hypothetical protein